jgi:predicted dehydrogenase
MRIVVCGFGSIGRRHVANSRALVPGARWTIVEPHQAAWRTDGETLFVADLDALDGDFDVAMICSPTHLHAEHVSALAGRAAAFFIEKPLAHDRAALAAIQRALARHDPPTMIGCNYRFETGLACLQSRLAGGAIGTPLYARAEFGQWLPSWRPTTDYRTGYAARRATGGGVILDRIHELDYMMWLCGAPLAIKAMSGKLSTLELETEDTADILLRFPTGMIGSIHVDYLQRAYTCSLEIVGERGTLAWRYRPTSVRLLPESGPPWQTLFEESEPDVNAMYVAELDHFFAALASGTRPTNGLEEAARTLEVALSALEQA